MEIKSLIVIGVVLAGVTGTMYLYENHLYTGSHRVTGLLRGALTSMTGVTICTMIREDGEQVNLFLAAVSAEELNEYANKEVNLRFSQTATGKCKFLSIEEVT